MTDEEESEFVLKFGGNLNYSTFLHRNLKFALFSIAKYVFFYLRKRCFVAIYTLLRGEKLYEEKNGGSKILPQLYHL